MKNNAFLVAVCLLAYFPKATTDVETAWLKDVTTRLQTDKRGVTGPDLPDQLSFHLKSKSHALALNLKRNYQIDPNVDIYIVRKLKNDRPILEKTQNLEKVDVAYYQDLENGAFMTARCVKRSSGQCDIFINGNIRLGDRSYDLRPSEADDTPNDLLEITGLRGKRYTLQDQANIQSEMSVENNEETNLIETNVQEKHIDRLRRIPYGRDKPNLFLNPEVMSSNRIVARLQNTLPTGENKYGRQNTKNDKSRNLNRYYVDVVVLADAGIWQLFLSMTHSVEPSERDNKAMTNLREYFVHIINGVDQLYKGIDDPRIEISVGISAFVVFQTETRFPHRESKVQVYQGLTVIDGYKYFNDIKYWDVNIGSKRLPAYDQIIFFTRHVMYAGTIADTDFDGLSLPASVCDIGRRIVIVIVADYFKTTVGAAHELGHALGALHDGDDKASACSSKDFFIMSSDPPKFTPKKKYTGNPWLFSQCSVEAFKRTLVNKTCVTTKQVHDQGIMDQFNRILSKQPGERFTYDEQCVLINGYGSRYCGRKLACICRFMRCTDPETGKCKEKYFSAATGTTCGDQKSSVRKERTNIIGHILQKNRTKHDVPFTRPNITATCSYGQEQTS